MYENLYLDGIIKELGVTKEHELKDIEQIVYNVCSKDISFHMLYIVPFYWDYKGLSEIIYNHLRNNLASEKYESNVSKQIDELLESLHHEKIDVLKVREELITLFQLYRETIVYDLNKLEKYAHTNFRNTEVFEGVKYALWFIRASLNKNV